MSFKTPSRSSPKNGGIRSCLCKNNTYSRKCCDGTLWAQGIGSITRNTDNNENLQNLSITETNLNNITTNKL
jgi:hypothetical protein